jgi:hypothetical protein
MRISLGHRRPLRRADKDIELAAHDLLQYLDKKTGLEPTQ